MTYEQALTIATCVGITGAIAVAIIVMFIALERKIKKKPNVKEINIEVIDKILYDPDFDPEPIFREALLHYLIEKSKTPKGRHYIKNNVVLAKYLGDAELICLGDQRCPTGAVGVTGPSYPNASRMLSNIAINPKTGIPTMKVHGPHPKRPY